ncbi:MAG: hypothetical protein HY544_01260 [Candidatus Diapherotrites archaeon]|uniref:Uncharacterized protein n=1 Tax=Candidatus Iainarchaeum sp. TaxID=3101447 RepID=A0A8T3YKA7_9ARCH|nr:hypothetical protein [Candidatus Diapherotrites archaeon]
MKKLVPAWILVLLMIGTVFALSGCAQEDTKKPAQPGQKTPDAAKNGATNNGSGSDKPANPADTQGPPALPA